MNRSKVKDIKETIVKSRKLKVRKTFLLFTFYFLLSAFYFLLAFPIAAQNKYEDRFISDIQIKFEETGREQSATDQFLSIIKGVLGTKYSAVKLRETLQALVDSGKIVSASIEATENGTNAVNLRFIIKRKRQAEKVIIEIGETVGDKVTEQELLLKLNVLNPGTAITEQTLNNNADLILAYLRERGFYQAKVVPLQKSLSSQTEVAVIFQVVPNTQAKVEKFDINIEGFDIAKVRKKLKLQPDEFYSKEQLDKDLEKIKEALREQKFSCAAFG